MAQPGLYVYMFKSEHINVQEPSKSCELRSLIQGIWQDAERNHKLRRNLGAYYTEDLVNYAVKIANYAVVLEQMIRKNQSITQKKIANYTDV